MIWQSGKTLCEGRALTVAKAALPSRTPPGHAEKIRARYVNYQLLTFPFCVVMWVTQSKNKILIKPIECQSTRIPFSTHRQGVLVLLYVYIFG